MSIYQYYKEFISSLFTNAYNAYSEMIIIRIIRHSWYQYHCILYTLSHIPNAATSLSSWLLPGVNMTVFALPFLTIKVFFEKNQCTVSAQTISISSTKNLCIQWILKKFRALESFKKVSIKKLVSTKIPVSCMPAILMQYLARVMGLI